MTEPTIRPETPADIPAIFRVHAAAFPTDAEAQLVDRLREAGHLSLSLVAEVGNEIVGHVALSPITIEGEVMNGLGLAPIGVLPALQRRGIGAALMRAALDATNAAFVVLLGDPAWYGRFGFEPAPRHGLSDEYGGGDAFQVRGEVPRRGIVRYAPEFAGLEG